MRAAAENLTRVNLELGGKAPAVVLASADLDVAANAVYQSRILNTGQVCNCAERVYVERSIPPAFTDKVVSLMKSTTYGAPLADRSVSMGPLVSAQQLAKVAAAVEQARKQGAQLALGGKIADRKTGHHYEPTVLVDCKHEMDIMRSERFGPVLPIQAIDSLDEGIRYANDSEYGLTSSIFTNDLNAGMHACRELKFGETYVNREHFRRCRASMPAAVSPASEGRTGNTVCTSIWKPRLCTCRRSRGRYRGPRRAQAATPAST